MFCNKTTNTVDHRPCVLDVLHRGVTPCTSEEPTTNVITVGVYSLESEKRLVDRYADEDFFANRAEDEPDKIFFFPTDPRWEHVSAYIGVPWGYVHGKEDYVYHKDWVEFLIEVLYGGTVWYCQQVVHKDDLKEEDRLYNLILDTMVKRVDEYMDGRPNDA